MTHARNLDFRAGIEPAYLVLQTSASPSGSRKLWPGKMESNHPRMRLQRTALPLSYFPMLAPSLGLEPSATDLTERPTRLGQLDGMLNWFSRDDSNVDYAGQSRASYH